MLIKKIIFVILHETLHWLLGKIVGEKASFGLGVSSVYEFLEDSSTLMRKRSNLCIPKVHLQTKLRFVDIRKKVDALLFKDREVAYSLSRGYFFLMILKLLSKRVSSTF